MHIMFKVTTLKFRNIRRIAKQLSLQCYQQIGTANSLEQLNGRESFLPE